jgi:SAM-dependent methyltransferase
VSSSHPADPVLRRELQYHERLYSGFAQQHFARPAVRALRRHMVSHILRATGARGRVLSLGCGIGDTEILLAPDVKEVVGVDVSGTAVRQARADASKSGVKNAHFLEGGFPGLDLPAASFDLVLGIFFLHHLPDSLLDQVPFRIREVLKPGGVFYGLDPSRWRLSGAVGSLLIPHIMRKYQSPDERELDAPDVASRFS